MHGKYREIRKLKERGAFESRKEISTVEKEGSRGREEGEKGQELQNEINQTATSCRNMS